jgi:hypothetical protein
MKVFFIDIYEKLGIIVCKISTNVSVSLQAQNKAGGLTRLGIRQSNLASPLDVPSLTANIFCCGH